MATGVEIAGLVLGAMPLVIYALESYRKGLAPLLDYFHYESTLTKLRTRLNIQHVLFEDHLKRLLLSQSSPAEIEALFYDPNEHTRITIWASQEVEQKLRKKLGPHQFKIFVDVLQEMDGVMKKLMVNLDIDMKGKPKWAPVVSSDPSIPQTQSSPRIEWEWRRVRRSFNKRKREELIQDFERQNKVIAAFVQNKEILAPRTEEVDIKSIVAYFDLVRGQAWSLYEILATSWKCSCGTPHNANLHVAHLRPALPSPLFKVSFSYHARDGQTRSESWRETTIQIEAKDATSVEHCLCEAIRDTSTQLQVGYFLHTSQGHLANISATKVTTAAQNPPTVLHLKNLLSLEHNIANQPSRLKKLSQKQRLSIAVALASSVLQFYESPWLQDMWGEQDVHFFFYGVDKHMRPVISNPCLSRSFRRQPDDPMILAANQDPENRLLNAQIVNKTLFALGIVLMELCLNKSLDQLSEASDVQTKGHLSVVDAYQIAMDNVDDVFDEGGGEYGRVVQRCLRCEFGIQDNLKRLDFDRFRALVYEGVIAPLEQDLKQFSI